MADVPHAHCAQAEGGRRRSVLYGRPDLPGAETVLPFFGCKATSAECCRLRTTWRASNSAASWIWGAERCVCFSAPVLSVAHRDCLLYVQETTMPSSGTGKPAGAASRLPASARPQRRVSHGVQGMLSIACALLGAPCVLGVDIDEESLATAAANVAEFEGLPIELIQADVAHLSTALPELRSERGPAFDVAVCNPPFGAWVKGADTAFLATAFKVRRTSAQLARTHLSLACCERRSSLAARLGAFRLGCVGSAAGCLVCTGNPRGGLLAAQTLDALAHHAICNACSGRRRSKRHG